MAVIVNPIYETITEMVPQHHTVEVARTYTVTLSEREAALVAYLVGSVYARGLGGALFAELDALGFKSHLEYNAIGTILPEEFIGHLQTLSDRRA